MTEHFFTPETETFPIPEAELKAKKLVNKLIEYYNDQNNHYKHIEEPYRSYMWTSRKNGLELAIDRAKQMLLNDWSCNYEPYDLGDKS